MLESQTFDTDRTRPLAHRTVVSPVLTETSPSIPHVLQ